MFCSCSVFWPRFGYTISTIVITHAVYNCDVQNMALLITVWIRNNPIRRQEDEDQFQADYQETTKNQTGSRVWLVGYTSVNIVRLKNKDIYIYIYKQY